MVRSRLVDILGSSKPSWLKSWENQVLPIWCIFVVLSILLSWGRFCKRLFLKCTNVKMWQINKRNLSWKHSRDLTSIANWTGLIESRVFYLFLHGFLLFSHLRSLLQCLKISMDNSWMTNSLHKFYIELCSCSVLLNNSCNTSDWK